VSSSLNTALLLGGLATGGFLLYRHARTGQQQENVWASLEQAIGALLASEQQSTTVPKSNTPGPTQTAGVTTKTYQVGDVAGPGESYQLPEDSLFKGGPEPLRVVRVFDGVPHWSTLPDDVLDAFYAQFEK